MKTFKKLVLGAIIAVPLFLAPARSQAGIISDLLHDLFGHKDKDKDKDWDHKKDSSSGNSVPINGGLTILWVAGLALGTKLMVDRNKKLAKPAIL